jgi:general secretion pathway protein G
MKRWLKVVAFFFLFLLIVGGVFSGFPRWIACQQPERLEHAALQQNLLTMRRAIDRYWQDKEKPPQSLQVLVDSGYLREIPADPLTRSNQTWIVERKKDSPNTPSGIVNVISAAAGADKNGKPYNQY